MLYVSHAPDEVTRLADHLVMLDQGRVTASGALTEMLSRVDAIGDDTHLGVAHRQEIWVQMKSVALME